MRPLSGLRLGAKANSMRGSDVRPLPKWPQQSWCFHTPTNTKPKGLKILQIHAEEAGLEFIPKRGTSDAVKAAVAIVVIVGIIGAFYLIRNYTGFGGFPTLQIRNGDSGVVHASTTDTSQYTWGLNPQIVVQNRGTAAASNVEVLWSISGGPLTQPIQGLSKVGTILPGTSQTVSWTFNSGPTVAPFPTYIVTATLQYAQGQNIVETVTLTPPASCAQTPAATPCQ